MKTNTHKKRMRFSSDFTILRLLDTLKKAFKYFTIVFKYDYLLAVHILKFFEAVEIDLLSEADKKTFKVFNV